jgi:hypothetical protein
MGSNGITMKDFQRFKQIVQSTPKDVRNIGWTTDTTMDAILKDLDKKDCDNWSNLQDIPAYLWRTEVHGQSREQAHQQNTCISAMKNLLQINDALPHYDPQSKRSVITPEAMQRLEASIKMREGR